MTPEETGREESRTMEKIAAKMAKIKAFQEKITEERLDKKTRKRQRREYLQIYCALLAAGTNVAANFEEAIDNFERRMKTRGL